MTPLAIGALVTVAALAPVAVLCWLAAKAPLGYEDSDGWHAGEPDEHADPENMGI